MIRSLRPSPHQWAMSQVLTLIHTHAHSDFPPAQSKYNFIVTLHPSVVRNSLCFSVSLSVTSCRGAG